MTSKSLILSVLICSIQAFADLSLSINEEASTCSNEDSFKNICLALQYEYMRTISMVEVKINDEKTKCKQIPLISKEDGIKRNYDGAFCQIDALGTRCIIYISDNKHEFIDFIYKHIEDTCVPDSNTKVRNKAEYLEKGKKLKAKLTHPTPPEKKFQRGKALCDNEKTMKKICVGLRNDYNIEQSYDEAKITETYSKCVQNDDPDKYRMALCKLNRFLTTCIMDGFDEDEFIVLYFNDSGEKTQCIWDADIKIKSKKKYLERGTSALMGRTAIRRGFLSYLRRLFSFITG